MEIIQHCDVNIYGTISFVACAKQQSTKTFDVKRKCRKMLTNVSKGDILNESLECDTEKMVFEN